MKAKTEVAEPEARRTLFEFDICPRGRRAVPTDRATCLYDSKHQRYLLTFPPPWDGTSEVTVVINGDRALLTLRQELAQPAGKGSRSSIDPPPEDTREALAEAAQKCADRFDAQAPRNRIVVLVTDAAGDWVAVGSNTPHGDALAIIRSALTGDDLRFHDITNG